MRNTWYEPPGSDYFDPPLQPDDEPDTRTDAERDRDSLLEAQAEYDDWEARWNAETGKIEGMPILHA